MSDEFEGNVQPGRCCKLGVSCQRVPPAQQGTRSCLQGKSSSGQTHSCAALLFQQCCINSTGLTSQHICQTFSSNKMFALEGPFCSCKPWVDASARFVLHIELLQQLHPGSVALVPPLLLELWLLQKPLMPLPEQPPLCGCRGRAGRAPCD